ncbi:MAG: transglycosylase SLT domain-containing protein [Prevotella sp.]|nr:transglycosylase SLT domain-containing protein [Prevotella sp.]
MRKFYIVLLSLFFAGTCTINAQVDIEDDEDESETEVTVTNKEGKEEQIELPEAMTYELDSLLYLYNSKTYLRPDSSCDFPDINPQYTKEEIMARLKMLPTVIEMPYNDAVQKMIDRYSGHLRHSVSFMLGAQNFYMPIFEEALESYRLPLELKYLPVIESALNPRAVSRVGATGLWQFMISTAKHYGLKVNSLVDERRDPLKSSYAAAQYLSDLYKIFGDWNLVIAAYNCGPDKLNRAIHRSGGSRDYWQIYPYLPAETRGYVPAFIAANYIMNYYCDYNICPMLSTLPVKTDTVMLSRDVHFKQVAGVLGISVDQLRDLNPQYRRNVVNGNNSPMPIRLPVADISRFIDNEDSIYAYNADELLTKRDEVDVNDDDVPTVQRVRSYSSSSSKASRRSKKSGRGKDKSKKKKKKNSGSASITVRSGDTLSEIARRQHTTVKKLKKLNGISGSTIRAGKKIKVK